MTQPVYKLFLVKPLAAWYQLSKEEQDTLLAKDNEALKKVGGKRIVVCKSGWSSEQWPFFGVEEFPDIKAVQKYSELLDELNWSRYSESMTLLGTEWKPL